MVKKGEFTKVSVPTILTDEIDELLKVESFLYTTKADFVTDVIRKEIQKIKEKTKEEKFPKRKK